MSYSNDYKLFVKCCPTIWRDIQRQHYLVKRVYEGLYANQKDLDLHAASVIIANIVEPHRFKMKTQQVETMCLFAALFNGRPTVYLEPEHCAVLVNTNLPEDITPADLNLPWPAFRIMLPKGGLRAKARNGTPMGLLCMDVFLWEAGQSLALPWQYAAELSHFSMSVQGSLRWSTQQFLDHYTGTQEESGIYISAITDYKQSAAYERDVLTTVIPFYGDYPVSKLVKSTGTKLEGSLDDEWMAPGLLDMGRALLWNILIDCNKEPVFIPNKEEWIRKPRLEGKHYKPGLKAAKYFSEMTQELWEEPEYREPCEPTGRHLPWHWVKGHRKRQHYGPGMKQSKLIHIRPYRTTGKGFDENAAA